MSEVSAVSTVASSSGTVSTSRAEQWEGRGFSGGEVGGAIGGSEDGREAEEEGDMPEG